MPRPCRTVVFSRSDSLESAGYTRVEWREGLTLSIEAEYTIATTGTGRH